MSLHHGLSAIHEEFRSLLASEDGQAIPEYAMITGMFGVGAIGSLIVIAAVAATTLAGTQGRVTNASVNLPTP